MKNTDKKTPIPQSLKTAVSKSVCGHPSILVIENPINGTKKCLNCGKTGC